MARTKVLLEINLGESKLTDEEIVFLIKYGFALEKEANPFRFAGVSVESVEVVSKPTSPENREG